MVENLKHDEPQVQSDNLGLDDTAGDLFFEQELAGWSTTHTEVTEPPQPTASQAQIKVDDEAAVEENAQSEPEGENTSETGPSTSLEETLQDGHPQPGEEVASLEENKQQNHDVPDNAAEPSIPVDDKEDAHANVQPVLPETNADIEDDGPGSTEQPGATANEEQPGTDSHAESQDDTTITKDPVTGIQEPAPDNQDPQVEPPKEQPHPDQPPPDQDPPTLPNSLQETPENRRLVLLTPANGPNPNLCKFALSAIALGYPAPVIVNWGRDPHEMSRWDGGPNLSKISGVARYLDAVLRDDAHPDERLRADDVVVVADAFDVWFQLPPQVLLRRYHAINDRAEARLRQTWPHDNNTTPMPMRQTIVAAAQKRCWPSIEEGADLHCSELPPSPLREDLYGPDTDKDFSEDKVFSNVRPRYINGGVYVGAAGDLQRMFRRAFAKVDAETSKGVHLFSEQGVTGEILGEQEVWRSWRRGLAVPDNAAAMGLAQRDFEYHIGLDYAQELSLATCHSEDDGSIVALNNQTDVDAHSAQRGISPARVHGVPEDVRAAPNPLHGLVDHPPDWGDMPLFTNFYTEAVPPLLHHNAWKDNLKERRVWWWDRTWFFPHLRALVERNLQPAAPRPLATVQTSSRSVTYWGSRPDGGGRGRPRLLVDKAFAPLEEIEFDALCRSEDESVYSEKHWWDEVFRDGKGPI